MAVAQVFIGSQSPNTDGLRVFERESAYSKKPAELLAGFLLRLDLRGWDLTSDDEMVAFLLGRRPIELLAESR